MMMLLKVYSPRLKTYSIRLKDYSSSKYLLTLNKIDLLIVEWELH